MLPAVSIGIRWHARTWGGASKTHAGGPEKRDRSLTNVSRGSVSASIAIGGWTCHGPPGGVGELVWPGTPLSNYLAQSIAHGARPRKRSRAGCCTDKGRLGVRVSLMRRDVLSPPANPLEGRFF